MRGDGSLVLRGKIWWLYLWVNCKAHAESTKCTDRAKAEKYRRHRVKELHAHQVAKTEFFSQKDRKKKVSELLDELWGKLVLRGQGSPQNRSQIEIQKDGDEDAVRRGRARQGPRRRRPSVSTREAFGDWAALSLTSKDVNDWIASQIKAGYSNATVNRKIQMLKQSYTEAGLKPPHGIVHLDEKGNVRKGFFEPSEFEAVAPNLPLHIRQLIDFLYKAGWRRGEGSTIGWDDVEADKIKLRAEHSKNGFARSVPLVDEFGEPNELGVLIEQQRAARRCSDGTLSKYVFHNDGRPIKEFREQWARACTLAGLGKYHCPECDAVVDAKNCCAACDRKWRREQLRYRGRLVHDLRRTAVRNYVRGGAPMSVAMSLTGHRTMSTFLRYNITSDDDQRKAMGGAERYRNRFETVEPHETTTETKTTTEQQAVVRTGRVQ